LSFRAKNDVVLFQYFEKVEGEKGKGKKSKKVISTGGGRRAAF
jgi:hypothetical protein